MPNHTQTVQSMPSRSPALPQQLTYNICATAHVRDLDQLVANSLGSMNAIHVAAAIVRLANLIAASGNGSGDLHVDASSSTNVPPAWQNEQPSSSGVDGIRDLAASLLARLGSKYLEHCDMGSYVGARQHANIAWAIGKMGLDPPPGMLDRISDQLTEDRGRRLDTATPQELSNLALGLARTAYSGVPIWSAIASKAPAKLDQFKPQELSNLAWACVAVHDDMGNVRGLVRDIARQSVFRVTSFKPQELSSLLRAVAKMGLHSEGALFDAAARHCIQLVKQQRAAKPTTNQTTSAEARLNSQDVANILWSFAKVGSRNMPLLEALGDAISSSSVDPGDSGSCARLGTFRPQELSIVLWSYATLGYTHLGVLQAAMQQLSIRSNQLSPQALANACWAAGRMARCRLDASTARRSSSSDNTVSNINGQDRKGGVGSSSGAGWEEALTPGLLQFVRSMSKQASGASKLFSGQELANTLWGLTKVNQAISNQRDSVPGPSLDSPSTSASGQVGEEGQTNASPRPSFAVSSPGSTLPSRGQRQDSLLLPLVDAARGRAGSMAPSSLAQIAWAGSHLEGGFQSSGSGSLLASAVASAALPRMHEFGAQELTTLVHSLAQRQEEVDWALFRAAGDAAVPLLRDGAFTPAGMANIVWAFGRKGQVHHEMAEAVSLAALPRLQHFSPQELANLLWGLYQLGRRDRALLDRAALHVGSRAWQSVSAHPQLTTGSAGSQGRSVGRAAAVVTWCFARCGYYSPRLYDSLAEAVIPHIDTIAPYNLGQLLWAMSAHEHRHERLLLAAGDTVARRLTLNPRPWSSPTGDSAIMKRQGRRGAAGCVPPDDEGADNNNGDSGGHRAEVEAMHPTDVSVVAWVYAKLGYHHAPLFEAILYSAMLHPELYDLRGWSRLAWSFSTLSLPQEALFMGRLESQSLRRQRREVALEDSSENLPSDSVDEVDEGTGWERRRSADSASGESWASWVIRGQGTASGGKWPGGSTLTAVPSRTPLQYTTGSSSSSPESPNGSTRRRTLWPSQQPSRAKLQSSVKSFTSSSGKRALRQTPPSGLTSSSLDFLEGEGGSLASGTEQQSLLPRPSRLGATAAGGPEKVIELKS